MPFLYVKLTDHCQQSSPVHALKLDLERTPYTIIKMEIIKKEGLNYEGFDD